MSKPKQEALTEEADKREAAPVHEREEPGGDLVPQVVYAASQARETV